MDLITQLTSKNDKEACALTDMIILESKNSNQWYNYFDDFVSLLNHPKSLVRNRAINLIAINIQWDNDHKFDSILSDFLCHITDEKPITARQCVKSLAFIGQIKKDYIPMILSALNSADVSKYKDSMRPLIEKDIEQTKQILFNCSDI